MIKRCQVDNCNELSAHIIRLDDEYSNPKLIWICEKHYQELQDELENLSKKIDNMTEEEKLNRLEELNTKKLLN